VRTHRTAQLWLGGLRLSQSAYYGRQGRISSMSALYIGKINRKDFGLTWNIALKTGGVLVGDEVTIALASNS
jgi:polyisoprenoid-binding protein YceI